MLDWADTFAPSSPLLDLVLRGTLVFLGLMLLLRVVGQREAGGLGLTDLLVVVLVADAASSGLTGERWDAERLGRASTASLLFHLASNSADGAVPMSPGWGAPSKPTPGMCREVARPPANSQTAL